MTPLPTFAALGDGPTVLMLHGIGGGHAAFQPQLEALAGWGYRAVAWDMPGYGRSAPVEPYTFKGLALSCIALIEALVAAKGERGVSLVGHSMGGMVAQEVIARRPDLIDRLVLCGTSAAFGRKPGGEASLAWQEKFIQERTAPLDAGQTMDELASALVPSMVGTDADGAGVVLARECMAGVSPSTYRRALQALVTFDREADLGRIAVPTLLVAGEQDHSATTQVMHHMSTQVPGSELVVLPGIGHLMNMEAPDAFSRVLLRFFKRTESNHAVH